MAVYQTVSLNISDNQKEKIQHALNNKIPVTIRINATEGNDKLALTKRQINKLNNAFSKNKGADITLSLKQIKHNMKIEGGFLPMLMSLAKSALPIISSIAKPLGIGALTGLASTGVQKLFGNGLYLKKGGCLCQIETDGKGLYLGKFTGNGLENYGDGLYLSREGQIYDGSGFLGDLVKNIPFLNLLL